MLTFDAEKHEYKIDGVTVPSVTHIISTYLNQYRGVPAELMKQAGAFGTAVHSMCELFLSNTLDLESLDSQLLPYLEGFKKFAGENAEVGDVWTVEKKLFSKRLMLAGTADIITPNAICDLKTRSFNRQTDPLQLAAYDKLDGGNGNSKGHYVVEILPNDYNLTKCNEPLAWPLFAKMLKHYHDTQKLDDYLTGWRTR